MPIEKINIEKFLELSAQYPVIDVRSPGEYEHAHFPGAHSLPLFSNEERAVVGTAYKQEGRKKAIKIGLDFFGPKTRSMVEEAEAIGNRKYAISNKETTSTNTLPIAHCLLVYCWRGGMRSASVAWLLDLYGFKIYILEGGYKTFRRYALETFKLPFSFRILGGYTGSGKTELLKAIEEKGEPVIDLEGIANHKGSAFGNIGMPAQPGQEMFENLLALELRKKIEDGDRQSNLAKPIWMEDESQRIGLVNLPGDLWANMRRSPISFLDIPFETRLEHIVKEYGMLDKQKLIDAIGRIQEKLGGLNAKMAISYLEQGELVESFRILLEYYDRHYFKALHNRKEINSLLHTIECKSITSENANQLLHPSLYKPEEA